MRHLGRVLGIVIIALGGAVFCGCQAPPAAGPAGDSRMPSTRLVTIPDPADNQPGFGSTTFADTASVNSTNKVLVPYRPPPRRAEIPPAAPSPQALWEAGHWFWAGARYVWSPGRYIERPQPDANWIPGYWQQEAGGWVWVEGRWT